MLNLYILFYLFYSDAWGECRDSANMFKNCFILLQQVPEIDCVLILTIK